MYCNILGSFVIAEDISLAEGSMAAASSERGVKGTVVIISAIQKWRIVSSTDGGVSSEPVRGRHV